MQLAAQLQSEAFVRHMGNHVCAETVRKHPEAEASQIASASTSASSWAHASFFPSCSEKYRSCRICPDSSASSLTRSRAFSGLSRLQKRLSPATGVDGGSDVEGGAQEVKYEADEDADPPSKYEDPRSQSDAGSESPPKRPASSRPSGEKLFVEDDADSEGASPPLVKPSGQGVSFAPFLRSDSKKEKKPRRNSATSVKLIKQLGLKTSNRLKLIIENKSNIQDLYTMQHVVGEGSFGSVRAAKVKATGALRAVKSILKGKKKRMTMLKTEIEITKMVDHPNIIKLYEIFEDVTHIYLVMEFCSGGHLLDRLKSLGRFTEAQAASAMMQIFRAVNYMHKFCICHRDLKCENFLLATPEPVESAALKITDFGLSCTVKENEVLTSFAGTPAYMAPEVIARHYGQACDMWSCGVNMFMLLCGYLPFTGDSDAEIHAKVKAGKYDFIATDWVDASEDAMSLVALLLRMDPSKRYTAQDALHHDWVTKQTPKDKDLQLQPHLVQNLRGFRRQNKFKKAALHLIASLLNEEYLEESHEAFLYLDSDGDGKLSLNELQRGLDNDPILEGDSHLKDIFYEPDADEGNGAFYDYSYTEFIAATFDRKSTVKKHIARAAFDFFDQNKDGSISSSELSTGCLLGKMTPVELQKMVADLDINCDGAIDFDEFMQMMREEL